LERLSYDHVLPPFFLRRLKFTNAPYVSIIIFATTSLAIFAVVDTNITILSGIFTVAFLIMVGLFAFSDLLLKVNRDRLVREPRVGLPVVLLALLIVSAAIAGNVAMSPVIVGYFAVFFLFALMAMTYTGYRGKLLLALYWIYTRNKKLHSWRWTRNWHIGLIESIRKGKKQPIIFFANTDEVQTHIS
jgi:amino acid transporter